MSIPSPSFSSALGELGAGLLESQASHALVAIATALRDIDHTKVKGKLRIELTLERSKGSGQLLVSHSLRFTRPTEHGQVTEEAHDDTLMYVSPRGQLSVVPETQNAFNFSTNSDRSDA